MMCERGVAASSALQPSVGSSLCHLVVHCNITLLLLLLALPFDPQIIAYNVPPPPMPFTPPPCFESLMGPEETAVFLHNKQPGRKERICPSCMTQYRCEQLQILHLYCTFLLQPMYLRLLRSTGVKGTLLAAHYRPSVLVQALPHAAQPPCMLCTEGSTLHVQLKSNAAHTIAC